VQYKIETFSVFINANINNFVGYLLVIVYVVELYYLHYLNYLNYLILDKYFDLLGFETL
jgi:hypothetical protein